MFTSREFLVGTAVGAGAIVLPLIGKTLYSVGRTKWEERKEQQKQEEIKNRKFDEE
jgi:hypothetical protein